MRKELSQAPEEQIGPSEHKGDTKAERVNVHPNQAQGPRAPQAPMRPVILLHAEQQAPGSTHCGREEGGEAASGSQAPAGPGEARAWPRTGAGGSRGPAARFRASDQGRVDRSRAPAKSRRWSGPVPAAISRAQAQCTPDKGIAPPPEARPPIAGGLVFRVPAPHCDRPITVHSTATRRLTPPLLPGCWAWLLSDVRDCLARARSRAIEMKGRAAAAPRAATSGLGLLSDGKPRCDLALGVQRRDVSPRAARSGLGLE